MKIFTILFILFLFALSAFAQQPNLSNYTCAEDTLAITFPAVNDGKFRFKTREKETDFGKTFATRQKVFNEKVYLEWQIGYDAFVEDVKSGRKQTILAQSTFIGSNGKEKYPYELSEILYDSVKCGLISLKDLDALQNEIGTYKKFFDEREIALEPLSNLSFNGVALKESAIKLPVFFMPQNLDGTIIEISIQKQQYASGVQPMIYFDIPFKSFADWKKLDGKKSVKGDQLKYVVKKATAEAILNLFRVFGMASARHKYDVEQILKVLKKLI